MKVAILTLFGSRDNYGQVLQSYALCFVLKKMGHEPYIVRYFPAERNSLKGRILYLLKEIYGKCKILAKAGVQYDNYLLDKKNKLRQFDRFRELYLPTSNKIYHSLSQLRDCPPDADCYITGSDQVWGQLLNNENNKAYFLDFGSNAIKRISYAASFARDTYPEELKGELKNQLLKFNNISVREPEGVDICKNIGLPDAELVLDPTLLLSKDDYGDLTSIKDIKQQERSIFIYCVNILNEDDIRWREIKDYAEYEKLAVFVTSASGYNPGYEVIQGAHYVYPTINMWLSCIKNSELFITTSFHGVAFSIVYNKAFIYIPLQGVHQQGNKRVQRLLERLNLCDRILSEDASVASIAGKTVDWEAVNDRMGLLKSESINYLHKSLEQ